MHEQTIEKLRSYHWPGNIRELQHAIEKAVILCEGNVIRPKDILVKQSWKPQTASVVPICSLFQIGGIVTYLNNINRKLRLFFDAIEDRDNTFSYPEQGINEEQQQLNRSLNRINALLAQTKMDYQKQEHFYRSLLEKVPNGIIAWNNSKKIIFVNNTALTLLNIESLTLYSQLENILQNEKNRKRLSLSQSQMKLQDETITLLSIQDIDDRLNENESESWSKLSHVLTHEIMNTIAPIISLSQTLASYPEIS